jgi:hypothetical protein
MSIVQVATQKIEQASGGNPALRDLLTSVATSVLQQQTATSTTPKNAPAQAAASVNYKDGVYIVAILNPDSAQPMTPQQAQAARANGENTDLAPVTSIYHQIRCATSLSFDVKSDVQTFGGVHGSTQVYWSLSGIAAVPSRYFQFRSSYDGNTWNEWKTANSGSAVNEAVGDISVDEVYNAKWASFKLPGGQRISLGQGYGYAGDTFEVAPGLYTSAMHVITGPDGFKTANGHLAHGWIENGYDLIGSTTDVPANLPPRLKFTYMDGEGNQWASYLGIFGMAFDPLGENVKRYTTGQGEWTEFVLPGGARLGFGTGYVNDNAAVDIPVEMPWVKRSASLVHVVPVNGFNSGTQAQGVGDAYFSPDTFVCRCTFSSIHYGSTWPALGRYMVIVWSPGMPVETTTGGKWVKLETPGGTRIAFGGGEIGTTAPGSGDFMVRLPAGMTSDKALTFTSPKQHYDTGHPMAGIFSCRLNPASYDLNLYNAALTYVDVDDPPNTWAGDIQWLGFAWG